LPTEPAEISYYQRVSVGLGPNMTKQGHRNGTIFRRDALVYMTTETHAQEHVALRERTAIVRGRTNPGTVIPKTVLDSSPSTRYVKEPT
jgi:hypothetical protein